MEMIMTNTTIQQRLTLKELEEQHVRTITQAPLQMSGSWDFDVTAETLFPHISDPNKMAGWFPLMKGGDLDHSATAQSGDWGEGSKRLCYTSGMGTLEETIHYWDAPHAYTYSAKNVMMPIRNHLGLLTVTPNDTDGATLIWRQYFDLTGIAVRHIFPTMMLGMMNQGMATLIKDLGGRGGQIVRA